MLPQNWPLPLQMQHQRCCPASFVLANCAAKNAGPFACTMHRVLTTILLQDPLSLSLPRQQAVAEVLAAVAAPLQPIAGGGGNSAAAINWAAGGIPPNTAALGAPPSASLANIPLLPLLHLVSGSPSAGVSACLQLCRVSLSTQS
jgi:hypothetical protein